MQGRRLQNVRRLSSSPAGGGDFTPAAAEREAGAHSSADGSRLWADSSSRALPTPTRRTTRSGARLPGGGADHVVPRDLEVHSLKEAVPAGVSRTAHRRLQGAAAEDGEAPLDPLTYAVATMSVSCLNIDLFRDCAYMLLLRYTGCQAYIERSCTE